MNHSIGRSGFWLASIVNTKEPEIRVELGIGGDEAKQYFAALESRKQEIERACGVPLTWHNPPEKASCRIHTRQKTDFTREDLWPQQHQWLKENLELFHRVFAPIVQDLEVQHQAEEQQ